MNLKDKKLLILAGVAAHNKVVEAAKRIGVYTIVTDNIENSPAKELASESWDISTTDIDALVSRCRQERIDGVLNFCIQTAQRPYWELCNRLGLPCYGTEKQFTIMNCKRLFKDLCRRYSIDVVPDYSILDVENNRVDYPLLIKPTDGRGTRGQTVCYDLKEVGSAIDKARSESNTGDFLIERYMTGVQDMSLSYIVIDGEPYLLKIGDRFLGKEKDGLDRQHMVSILPSKNVNRYIRDIHLRVCQMIKGLGVKFGPVFLQGFWNKGKMYMYDPALRFPGSDFDIALNKATGFDAVSSCVRFALTGDIKSCCGNPLDAYMYGGGNCLIASIAADPGTIASIAGFDKICEDPRIVSGMLYKKKGETIMRTGDVRQRVAEFIGYGQSRCDVCDLYRDIVENFQVLDIVGTNMITSTVDIDFLKKGLRK